MSGFFKSEMAKIIIGKRLEKIASLIKGRCLLDIGSDHAKLPIFALQHALVEFAFATDLNELPLLKGKSSAEALGVINIEFILASGLLLPHSVIDKSTDIVIAGMGGELIADILEKSDKERLKDKNLILQPMTRADELKLYLYSNGFEINSESVVYENDKYFLIIEANYSGKKHNVSEKELLLGKLNLSDPTVKDYLKFKIKKTEKIIKEISRSENSQAADVYIKQLEIYNEGVNSGEN